ncbi:MAG: type I glutamate--ammonia ligase [Deltaproteobacteria bacterium]|nr:type I glutamate--ammonia ligase [Deltaproteobacteria bacterium]
MTPKEVMQFVKEKELKVVDFKFLDFVGIWQHFSAPIQELSEETFEEGIGFDGSSIRGWQPIHNSDMLIVPDAGTAKIDPFVASPCLSLICNIVDPITREGYTRDPRFIAQKAEAYLKSSGIADVAYFGPEPEFFIFDDVRYSSGVNQSFHMLDSVEGIWNSGREEFPNLGYKPRHKEGYFPCAPTDSLVDLRNEMVEELQKVGLHIECMHHEVATGGQCEIDMRFDSLLTMGDNLQWFKYIIKNVAHRNGRTVTFMPKPLFGDNGSGMHCHQSLWKDGKNLFAGDGYGGLSKMALYYIGGIMKHAKALCAITNPSTNSYKRLVPGYEAPVNLAYSGRNRSASLRIPVTSNPKAKRVEFRTPDPACNGYLAFAAMVMAGLDGIENKIDPGEPLDKDIYGLSPEELRNVPKVAGSLEEALDFLEEDHEFLLKGDVFTKDVIDMWIDYKRSAEVDKVRMRPTPMEFELYFDC